MVDSLGEPMAGPIVKAEKSERPQGPFATSVVSPNMPLGLDGPSYAEAAVCNIVAQTSTKVGSISLSVCFVCQLVAMA